jgi:hypothetical protein
VFERVFTLPINISKTYNRSPAKDVLNIGFTTFILASVFTFVPVLTDDRVRWLDKIL